MNQSKFNHLFAIGQLTDEKNKLSVIEKKIKQLKEDLIKQEEEAVKQRMYVGFYENALSLFKEVEE